MQACSLICTALSPDGIVAHFACDGQPREVFAYLPHVPGLNPMLLRIGDRIQGRVVDKGRRLELVESLRQETRFQEGAVSDAPMDRICLPFPRADDGPAA